MERVVAWNLDVVWEPNVPQAVLITDDDGMTVLALNPRWDDEGPGCVVLTWYSKWASMSEPNDEALPGHRLYDAGLDELSAWGGLVEDSALVAELARQENVQFPGQGDGYVEYTHYVLPLKECLVEVVGSTVQIQRLQGSTLEAAVAGLVAVRAAVGR